MIIKGNTVGTPMPRSDWNQTDPTQADYIRNKPAIELMRGFDSGELPETQGQYCFSESDAQFVIVSITGEQYESHSAAIDCLAIHKEDTVYSHTLPSSLGGKLRVDKHEGTITITLPTEAVGHGVYISRVCGYRYGGSGGGDVDSEALNAHLANLNNPHRVTAKQIGAATVADLQNERMPLIVTLSEDGTRVDHDPQEILQNVEAGVNVYLYNGATYYPLSFASPYDTIFTVVGDDGIVEMYEIAQDCTVNMVELNLNGSVSESDRVSVKKYGAKGDGVYDDTDAINDAIAANANVFIPAGRYAIAKTIHLTGNRTITMENGVTLVKPVTCKDKAGNTFVVEDREPVVRITGNNNSIIGAGMTNSKIQSDVESPSGVLFIGDKIGEANPVDTMYNTVRDVGVVGHNPGGNDAGTATKAVYICCPDGWEKACFFNTLQNIYIENANNGLMLEGCANANIIENIQFYNVGNEKYLDGAAIHLRNPGAKDDGESRHPAENIITNAFHHHSDNALTLYLDGRCVMNFIENIACEQGGTASQGIKVATNSVSSTLGTGNIISIISNTKKSHEIPDEFKLNNTIQTYTSFRAPTINMEKLNRETADVAVHKKSVTVSNVAEGTNVKLITVKTSGANFLERTNITVDLDIWFYSTKAADLPPDVWGSRGRVRYLIAAGASGAISEVKRLNADATTDMLLEPIVNGKNVTFVVRFPDEGKKTADSTIYCDYKIIGRKDRFTVSTHTGDDKYYTDPVTLITVDEIQYQTKQDVMALIVDKLCPGFTVSGNVVACEPVEDYPLEVTVSEEATQITRCGKNLYMFNSSRTTSEEPPEAEQNPYYQDASEIELKDANGNTVTRYGYDIYLPAGTYTLNAHKKDKADTKDRYIYGRVVSPDGTVKECNIVEKTVHSAKTITIEPGDVLKVYIGSSSTSKENCITIFKTKFNIQIEVGEEATDYEEYYCDTFDVGENILAKKGVNSLYADKDEITVSGKADPVAIINKLVSKVLTTNNDN